MLNQNNLFSGHFADNNSERNEKTQAISLDWQQVEAQRAEKPGRKVDGKILSTSEFLPGLLLHIGYSVKVSCYTLSEKCLREARGSVNPSR